MVIPARFGSTRLPGKVLCELAGRTVIEHVAAAARRSGAAEVIVATDDERVSAAAARAGVESVLTGADHPSGSDRIREVADLRGWADDELIVNVQGDEPLMPWALIDQVARLLAEDAHADWATLATPIDKEWEYRDPNAVKLVCDRSGYALYFSRAPIPWDREGAGELPARGLEALRHIGLYAYRAGALRQVCAQAAPPLERTECLEQLRALWLGLRIKVALASELPPAGLDTPADLQRLVALMGDPRGA